MRFRRWTLCLLVVAAASTARADLTLRHTLSFHFASFLPPEMEAQVRQQMNAALPQQTVVRIKGGRVYSSFGPLFTITDYGQNRVTLLNPKTREFAAVPLDEYFDRVAAAPQIPALPPEAQRLLASVSFDVQTHKTGQMSLIQGIRAEQNVLTVSVNMPGGPQGAPSALKLEMQFWVAQADEIRRVPALRELADYAERARRAFDPAATLAKLFARMPGLSDSLRTPIEQLAQANGSLVLKLGGAVYIPALAQLLAFSGKAPDGIDPYGPFAEYQMDLAEISTAPIDDAVFTVPAGYQPAPLEKLIQAEIQMPSPTAPKPPQ
jgi:hypothetical protein